MRLYLIGILAIVSTSASQATASCDDPPKDPKDAQTVVECALKHHPSILTALAGIQQADELEPVAGQRPNPEFESQFTFGKTSGDNIVNGEITLAHVWELGGKRVARLARAKAERELAQASLDEAKENVFIELAESLVRLKQIASEKEVLAEALQSFSSITNALRKRALKNPEQEASLLIYDLARSDYRIRQATLESEEQSELRKLSLATGFAMSLSNRIHPNSRTAWPTLKPGTETINSASWKRTQAELHLEEANLALARSDSWPDVRLGPTMQTERQGAETLNTYGIALALPLPLYQQNGAGRSHARLGLSKAETALASMRRTLETEYEREYAIYQAAINSLRETKPFVELEREHRKIENLIERGLIQSSLVIEAHRQMFDLTRSAHEQELNATRALLQLRRIEGRLLEEKL